MVEAKMLNWIVFALSVGLMLYLGLRASKIAGTGSEGFILGGKTLGVFVGASTIVATGFSGWGFMGAPGVSYAYGGIELLFNFGFGVSITLATLFFAGPLRNRSHAMGSLTIPEYIGHSHANTLDQRRLLVGAAGLITLILLTVFFVGQVRAVGLLTSQWLGLPDWLAATIVISLIIFYTAFGGLAAVAWTDTVMAVGMCIACLYICGEIFTEYNIFDFVNQIRDKFPELINAPTAEPYGQSKINAYMSIPYAFMFAAILPYMASRFMGLRDDIKLSRVGMLTCVMCIIMSLVPIVGLYVRLKMPDLEVPDNAMPMYLANYVPPFIGSLIFLFILFAMQSTANSILQVIATAVAHDMRSAIFPDSKISDKRAVYLNRMAVVVLGFAGIFLTYFAPPLFLNYFAILGTGTLQAVLIGPVFIGTFWKGNAYGAFASMIAGGSVAGYFLITGHWGLGWVEAPLFGDLIGVITYFVVSSLTFGACPRRDIQHHSTMAAA